MLRSLTSGVPLYPTDGIVIPAADTVCISGHRRITGVPAGVSESEAESAMLLILCRLIDMAAEAGYRYFLSGLAKGTDLIAAAHIAELKARSDDVHLIGVMPYLLHAKHFSPRDAALLRAVEKSSDRVVLVNSDPKAVYGKPETTPYYHASPTVYRDRNYYMVDNSSAVIAYFTGEPRTGTGQTVNYAVRRGKRTVTFGTSEILRFIDIRRNGGDIYDFMPENVFELPF